MQLFTYFSYCRLNNWKRIDFIDQRALTMIKKDVRRLLIIMKAIILKIKATEGN